MWPQPSPKFGPGSRSLKTLKQHIKFPIHILKKMYRTFNLSLHTKNIIEDLLMKSTQRNKLNCLIFS